jgi:hypothetical protein
MTTPRIIFGLVLVVLGTSLMVFSATEYHTRMETLRRVEQSLQRELLEDGVQESEYRVHEIVGKALGRKSGWHSDVTPSLLFGGSILMVGLFAPFTKKRVKHRAEPGASPNGGPAETLGNSGVGGGPPSVS